MSPLRQVLNLGLLKVTLCWLQIVFVLVYVIKDLLCYVSIFFD
jgi:hypothetical protein